MVSLWDMITFVSGAAALGGAIAAEKSVGGGGMTLLVASSVGVLVGVACVASIRMLGTRAYRSIQLSEQRTGKPALLRIRLLYATGFAWLVVSNVLGFQLSKLAIRMLA